LKNIQHSSIGLCRGVKPNGHPSTNDSTGLPGCGSPINLRIVCSSYNTLDCSDSPTETLTNCNDDCNDLSGTRYKARFISAGPNERVKCR
jgi:hypothetical protein